MVLPRVSGSYAVLHQTGQRREDADGRVDRLPVQAPVEYDLAFGDVSGEVRDRMRDIIIRHGQYRKLCHGAVCSLYDAGTLVYGGQLAVQVSGISFTGRDLSF